MKSRKRTTIVVMVILASIIFASATHATSATKKIDALYQNIKIIVNGKQAAATPEPFIYDGTTYVPIRLVSEALGATVNWDGVNKKVIVDLKTEDPVSKQELESLRMQGYYKDSEIARLTKELEDLKKKIEEEEEAASKYKDLEDFLDDEYSRWNKISFKYYVDEYRKSVELIIEFDYDKYGDRWESLRERDIENWLKDIYDAADEIYDGKDFYGHIEDSVDGTILVEFYTEKGKLKVDFL
ncbi:MAG TPA: copper amine oxidase N-terminal domain-containing protein [Thermoanaerobacterales bacterium]|nr:copper amine oxidase N-terminal domain-containing protein [Thermoanaerobacterales bacterium]